MLQFIVYQRVFYALICCFYPLFWFLIKALTNASADFKIKLTINSKTTKNFKLFNQFILIMTNLINNRVRLSHARVMRCNFGEEPVAAVGEGHGKTGAALNDATVRRQLVVRLVVPVSTQTAHLEGVRVEWRTLMWWWITIFFKDY